MSAIDAGFGNRDTNNQRKLGIDYRWFATAFVVLSIIYVAFRLYQQAFGWSKGLDATSPDFNNYWMALFRIETPVLWSAGLLCWGYLIATRDRAIEKVKPEVELKRYFNLLMWLILYCFTFYWTGSFFTEADGTWHQTVLRDTSFTPVHIVLFYACIPLYLFFGVGSFVYGMTRVPAFCRGISLMHAFAVAGPALILPNLGFNEWGHAYWLTEEIFSHPLHWGFVVLAWSALCLSGVAMQLAAGIIRLMPQVVGQRVGAAE
jgi:methane/ammonia monooxygenase subunit C